MFLNYSVCQEFLIKTVIFVKLIKLNPDVEDKLINLEKEEVIDQIKLLKQQEIQLGTELKEKYGDGNISLENGEFTPFEVNEPSLAPA